MRIVLKLIPVAVLIAAVVCVGVLSSWFTNWDISTWFDKGEQSDVIGKDDEGNDVVAGSIVAMPRHMTFTTASSLSETPAALTLEATIAPAHATNKAVDWSVDWVDPTAAFAQNGSADLYVSVAPEHGTLRASVDCLQDFGAQIKIIVASQSNPEVTAECVLDFAQRITEFYLGGLNTDDEGIEFYADSPNVLEANRNYHIPQLTTCYDYTNYTVADTWNGKLTYGSNEAMHREIGLINGGVTKSVVGEYDIVGIDTHNAFTFDFNPPALNDYDTILRDYYLVPNWAFEYGEDITLWENLMLNWELPIFEYEFTLTGLYTSFTAVFQFRAASADMYEIAVTELSLDADSYLF